LRSIFPPGGISSTRSAPSKWREFAFGLHQIQQAIEPVLGLDKIVQNWNEIAGALAEPSRKRVPQLAMI
jgi:hypothetical protein